MSKNNSAVKWKVQRELNASGDVFTAAALLYIWLDLSTWKHFVGSWQEMGENFRTLGLEIEDEMSSNCCEGLSGNTLVAHVMDRWPLTSMLVCFWNRWNLGRWKSPLKNSIKLQKKFPSALGRRRITAVGLSMEWRGPNVKPMHTLVSPSNALTQWIQAEGREEGANSLMLESTSALNWFNLLLQIYWIDLNPAVPDIGPA